MSVSLRNNSIALLASLALVGCNSEEASAPPKPRPVITFVVPEEASDNTRRFSGETKAANSVELGFQLAGRISTILVEEGKRYPKDTPLAQLDPANVNADLRNAKAKAIQTSQQLRRSQELYESGNGSKADFDTAIANKNAAEAQLESARLAVQYTNLTMPYDGVISEIPADVNQVVSAGTPVISIQGEVGMDFEIGIPTNVISRVKEDQKVILLINDLSDTKITGTVTKVSPVASSNTTYPVTISIKEPEKIANLRAGLDGEVLFKFPGHADGGIPIPTMAVLASADGSTFVWLVDSPDKKTSKVTREPVKVGQLTGDGNIQIIEGLEPGNMVVSKGIQSLTPGMEVTLPQD